MMGRETFLIDSNSLITPFRSYYSFDLASKFWEKMGIAIKSGKVKILDLVAKELLNGSDDALEKWLVSLSVEYIDRRNNQVISEYRRILDYIQDNPCYKTEALTEWSKSDIADPWLIAVSSVYHTTLVTFEAPNKGLNSNSPSKNPKIPDVAAHFDVKTANLFYLMRQLQINLD
ncbi:DUF4411 family protein [Aedoeadaptatus coli]|uniref:DUF4411 family protein n=1 Tax=Aedoeadaptatus coli TaxID=2058292 RepID=UPI000D54B234|nr:DUF4411 family protein [Peptoniphilus coli]